MRPIIGITAYVEPARFGLWNTTTTLLPHDYVEHVARAGGQPVVLPPVGDPARVLPALDGLIVAGGADVDPSRYGAARHPQTKPAAAARDEAELALTEAAVAARLPLLGVCRGMQVLNVARGGTLHQHLPDVVGHARHCPAEAVFGHLRVRPEPGSMVGRILGGADVETAHYHHQAVDRLGDGLRATAWAADDPEPVVEAVELDGHPFAVGVQWHPETGDDGGLFTALVRAAAGR